jgi:F0F1-type ATP synthase epsilon subunit
MHLKITSLEWLIRDEDIKQLTIDTQNGQITVLPGHDNMLSVLKPGLVRIVPTQWHHERKFSFLLDKEYIVFGVLWGVLKVEGNEVQLLTNMVIVDNQNPLEILQQNKQLLQEKLQKAELMEWDHDLLESDLQKIEVELKLAFWKQK